jgi:hypothetical protein
MNLGNSARQQPRPPIFKTRCKGTPGEKKPCASAEACHTRGQVSQWSRSSRPLFKRLPVVPPSIPYHRPPLRLRINRFAALHIHQRRAVNQLRRGFISVMRSFSAAFGQTICARCTHPVPQDATPPHSRGSDECGARIQRTGGVMIARMFAQASGNNAIATLMKFAD